MDTGEHQASEIDIKAEYERLQKLEKNYLQKIKFLNIAKKVFRLLILFFFAVMSISTIFLPPRSSLQETLITHPIPTYAFIIGFSGTLLSILMSEALHSRTSKIKIKYGLSTEEEIFLRLYETRERIESLLKERNIDRKSYIRELALQSISKAIKLIDSWKLGNIRLVHQLLGDKIDLLKDNMRRLILSNIAKGDDETLGKISGILFEFCKYLHSPSIEKLENLNDKIRELPYKKYKILTKTERILLYFKSKPRLSRFLFASSITALIVVSLYCLNINITAVATIGATSFWGAFASFDRLFKIETETKTEWQAL